jgi:hypothetical protein
MTVLLDDQPLSLEHLPPEATVAEAVNEARARLAGSGLMIVALRNNNEVVADGQVERMLAEPISRFEHLELVSGRSEEVVLEALRQIREGFGQTFPAVKEVVEALTAGKLSEAMTLLAQCVRVWGQAQEAIIQSKSLLEVNFDDLEIDGRLITDWLNELAGKLKELKDVIESRDNVLLGDILRYEFDQTLQQWERMLGGFIAYVEQLGGPASTGGQ